MSRIPFPRRPAVLAVALGVACLLGLEPPAKAPPKTAAPAAAYRFSGPFTHDNLTIFLIHGKDALAGKKLLTLDEALAQKKAIVHETKNVNQLSIENVSATEEVFLQAGDIVKGGQQDRTLAYDLIVPPKSGKVALPAFCVEAGRWRGRGKEDVAKFSSSKDQVPTKGGKIAVRAAVSQDEVWKKVAMSQMALQRNLKADVKARASATSLQLTLEHKKLLEAVASHIKKLQASPDGKDDVIGYAAVINGQVSNADIYVTRDLFKKLWPKLLKASAVEAVAELQKDKKFKPATLDEVKAFLAAADKGKKAARDVNKRFRQVQQESPKCYLFETRDKANKGVAVRRSYIAK